ncbi:MAG: hypothetical protein MJE77_25700 [Proteobacteria bacterium]|nr:hypothetical protein [Pseudomonadota bacterium]
MNDPTPDEIQKKVDEILAEVKDWQESHPDELPVLAPEEFAVVVANAWLNGPYASRLETDPRPAIKEYIARDFLFIFDIVPDSLYPPNQLMDALTGEKMIIPIQAAMGVIGPCGKGG